MPLLIKIFTFAEIPFMNIFKKIYNTIFFFQIKNKIYKKEKNIVYLIEFRKSLDEHDLITHNEISELISKEILKLKILENSIFYAN